MTTPTRIRPPLLLPCWLLPLLLLSLPQSTRGFVPCCSRATRPWSALGSTASTQPAPPDVQYRSPADVPVWEVPPSIRREAQEEAEPPASRIQFLSLETLFPGPDGRRLAEAFDDDGRFRCV